MIFTTAYTSQMVEPLTVDELSAMLGRFRTRNADRGITGLLLYRRGRVLQMLEGPEQSVRDLYDRIASDVRHTSVVNVWSSSAAQRRFPDWTMGFEDLESTSAGVGDAAELGEAPATPDLGRSSSGAGQPADSYLARRVTILRRALATGDRLVAALAIILNGHDPETVAAEDGRAEIVRCRVCRPVDAVALDAYPCATAKNALWALEAAIR